MKLISKVRLERKYKEKQKPYKRSWDELDTRYLRRKENRCIHCGVKLTEENWSESKQNRYWCCRDCLNKRDRERRNKKRNEINKKRREREKLMFSSTKNKKIYGKPKRFYTGYCEVCGVENERLEYHHWDDSNTYKGMWLCRWCHAMAEALDRGKDASKYLSLKKQIDEIWQKGNTKL